MKKEKFYITTSIVYANAKPHIGFALELAQADAIARWQRLLGKEVYFLTGTDEHGIKIYHAAQEAGKKPQEFVDENTRAVQELTRRLNISNTDFIRTTDQKRHWPAAQKMWELLRDNGDIEKGHYTGYYSITDEAYLTKSEYESGNYKDKKVIELEEDNYLFRLDKYQKQLVKNIGKRPEIIPEHRAKEMLNFIQGGLNLISFSRPKEKLPWGVPVPDDDSQVMYVWCDALTNYLSALEWPKGEKYKKYWPSDVHVIGKDILRFHAVYWPAMLLSAGLELPKKILVHGHILSGGRKMSKSLGNVIDPIKLIDHWGVDPVRYYLLREIPTIEDGDYSTQRFTELYNSDLANNLGNLLSRVLKLAEGRALLVGYDPGLDIVQFWKDYQDLFNALTLDRVLLRVGMLTQKLNWFVDTSKPWLNILVGPLSVDNSIYALLEGLRHISIALYPFLPETSDRIRKQLGLRPIDPNNFDFQKEIKWGGLSKGHQVGKSVILFPKKSK